MTEPLTLDRFRALADAYGGVIDRWPVGARAAAMRMAADPVAQAILVDAGALDVALDAWMVPAPSAALRDLVMPVALPAARAWRRAKLWWSGIGIATALAGAAAGSVAAAAVAPADPPSEAATAFGDLGGQEA
jgi:hypothetical protein